MIHTEEDDEFERRAHEIEMKKGQPYVYEKKREWVGLTADEMESLYHLATYMDETDYIHMLMMAEEKLKEKNG